MSTAKNFLIYARPAKNSVDFQAVIVFPLNITPTGYQPAGYYE